MLWETRAKVKKKKKKYYNNNNKTHPWSFPSDPRISRQWGSLPSDTTKITSKSNRLRPITATPDPQRDKDHFHQIRGMAPTPVTNKLKDSPTVHEEKHLFTKQSLKKADSLASQHFRDFKSDYGSSQHQNFRPSSRGAPSFLPPRPQESRSLPPYRGRSLQTAPTHPKQANPYQPHQEFSSASFPSQPKGIFPRGRARGNPYSSRSASQPTQGQVRLWW